MKKCILFLCGIFVTIIFAANTSAAVVSISTMPAYNWYHGCGPTAAASIIGYYDLNGYDSLFNASDWDNVKLTSNVQDEISSPEHNAKYDSHPDASGPAPPDTSIADFFHTSDNQPYGWSWLSDADDAFIGYANYKGYSDWNAWNESYGNFTWNDLTTEIDNNRPIMFLVDTDGNGNADHFIPVFGYNDSTIEYGCYDTWSENETIRWETFQEMGNNWGIGYATYVRPGDLNPVPVPATILLLGTGLAGLAGKKIRSKKK